MVGGGVAEQAAGTGVGALRIAPQTCPLLPSGSGPSACVMVIGASSGTVRLPRVNDPVAVRTSHFQAAGSAPAGMSGQSPKS